MMQDLTLLIGMVPRMMIVMIHTTLEKPLTPWSSTIFTIPVHGEIVNNRIIKYLFLKQLLNNCSIRVVNHLIEAKILENYPNSRALHRAGTKKWFHGIVTEHTKIGQNYNPKNHLIPTDWVVRCREFTHTFGHLFP